MKGKGDTWTTRRKEVCQPIQRHSIVADRVSLNTDFNGFSYKSLRRSFEYRLLFISCNVHGPIVMSKASFVAIQNTEASEYPLSYRTYFPRSHPVILLKVA